MKGLDFKQMKRLTDPQAVKDLDRFLDKMPTNVGYNALIAAGITWALAGGALLFASTESTKLAELRSKLREVESLKPPVPRVEYVPLAKSSIEKFVEDVERIDLYPVLTFRPADGSLEISGADSEFTALSYAIGHVQAGGRNWHVDLNSLCIGPECTGSTLKANLKLSTIRINESSEDDVGIDG